MIAWNGDTVATTSFTAERNAGESIVAVSLWTSTISVCGSAWKPACLRIWSARWAWPTFAFASSICLVPTTLPRDDSGDHDASQPKTAVFQWLALQRPIRAAMLFDFFKGDMASARFLRIDGALEAVTGTRSRRWGRPVSVRCR